ncbi:YHS domain-containing protein, partial [bacterium]|nr:YHS domain-containing protein [bacterium]
MAIDPICGMTVNENTALSLEVEGETVYFCSEHCQQKFAESSQTMAAHDCCHGEAEHTKQVQSEATAKYICPMCPGIASDQPGDCPKCGMSLERNPAYQQSSQQKTIYTCPMHPEIEQDGPGDCPICGMDLEPKTVSLQTAEDDTELRNMTRRFWVATALSIPVLLLAMLPMVGVPVHQWLGSTLYAWLQLLM